jgi:hypothetical protein
MLPTKGGLLLKEPSLCSKKQLRTALHIPNCLKHQAGWQPLCGLPQTGEKSLPGLLEGQDP